MRINYSIEIYKEQYNTLRLILLDGAKQLNRKITFSNKLPAKSNPQEIFIIPPYGPIINKIRESKSVSGNFIMVDLKGPSGIDSCLMLKRKLNKGKVIYMTPYFGISKYQAYFKQLISNQVLIYPFPFFPSSRVYKLSNSEGFHNFSKNQKSLTSIFIGNIWGKRKKVLSNFHDTKDIYISENKLKIQDYLVKLSESKSAIDIKGLDNVTYRFFEIILSQTMCIFQSRPFFVLKKIPTNNEEIIIFKDVKQLKEIIQNLRDNKIDYDEIARKGYHWMKNTHSAADYLNYIIDVSKDKYDFDSQNHRIQDNFWTIQMKKENYA